MSNRGEHEQTEKRTPTWEEETEAFNERVRHLISLSSQVASFKVIGGELDQLDSGYAASIIFEVGGSILCTTAHSLSVEKVQMLVYQDVGQWLKHMRADYQ